MGKTSRRTGLPIRQKRDFRDARLIVIATEGEFTEKQYFECSTFKHNRVIIKVLETKDGRSSPEHVFDRAITFIKNREWLEGDECWLVVDFDRYEEQIRKVSSRCRKVRFCFAVSNPCFELWLYLHHANWPKGMPISSKDMVVKLRELLGEYNKKNIHPEKYVEGINAAIRRSRELASNDSFNGGWPTNPGTDVGNLVESIRNLLTCQ